MSILVLKYRRKGGLELYVRSNRKFIEIGSLGTDSVDSRY
jgi:hypothetical protein